VVFFVDALPQRIALREAERQRLQMEQEQREQERQRRLAARVARR